MKKEIKENKQWKYEERSYFGHGNIKTCAECGV